MVTVPVITSGGAGKLSDFVMLFKMEMFLLWQRVFHFTEMTPMDVKNDMKKNNVNIRVS